MVDHARACRRQPAAPKSTPRSSAPPPLSRRGCRIPWRERKLITVPGTVMAGTPAQRGGHALDRADGVRGADSRRGVRQRQRAVSRGRRCRSRPRRHSARDRIGPGGHPAAAPDRGRPARRRRRRRRRSACTPGSGGSWSEVALLPTLSLRLDLPFDAPLIAHHHRGRHRRGTVARARARALDHQARRLPDPSRRRRPRRRRRRALARPPHPRGGASRHLDHAARRRVAVRAQRRHAGDARRRLFPRRLDRAGLRRRTVRTVTGDAAGPGARGARSRRGRARASWRRRCRIARRSIRRRRRSR